MPNWCTNQLQIKGNAEDIKKFVEENKPKDKDDAGALSFDRSVPLPEGMDWYDWHIANWGTKWDVNDDSELHEHDDDSGVTYSFDTAWAPPVDWLRKTHRKYPSLTFHMAWVEDAMCFAGEVTAQHEEMWEINEFPDRQSEDYRRIYELVFGSTDGLDETEEATETTTNNQ
jgi:hypothetical protein